MKKPQKKSNKRRNFKDYDQRLSNFHQNPKTKISMQCKILAVNKNNSVKPTSRFFSGKMLMLVRLSLITFIYKLVEIFCFQNKTVKEIHEKCKIEKPLVGRY